MSLFSRLFARFESRDWDGTGPVTARHLRTALEQGEIIVHFQPEISAETSELEAVEALLRWRRGMDRVPAATFLSAAVADDEVLRMVGDLTLRAACHFGAWLREGHPINVSVAVNLSLRELLDPDLSDRILDARSEAGLSASQLAFEIAAHELVTDLAPGIDALAALREEGYRTTLDDFETTPEAANLLEGLPVDAVKVNIDPVISDPGLVAQTAAAVRRARAIGLRVTATHVETAQHMHVASSLGVDALQGFGVGEPFPEEQLTLEGAR